MYYKSQLPSHSVKGIVAMTFMPDKLIPLPIAIMCTTIAILLSGQTGFAQVSKQLQPYVAANKLYAVQKPADWRVVETNEPNRFRVQVLSPQGDSAVDFTWERNDRGHTNAVNSLLAYRRFLSQTRPDVAFTDIHVSRDNLRCVATVSFHVWGTAVQGRYYFESSPQSLSVQGYFAPSSSLGSQRAVLVNVMASMAFIKKDPRPETAVSKPDYYRPNLVQRVASDRSLSMKAPEDWNFNAAGGKVITGSRNGAPGFIFTSLNGNPILRGATIAQGIIGSRYLNPQQTLSHLLQAFGHRNVRIDSANQDATSARNLVAAIGRQGEAQDITAYWTSSGGLPCVGGFKVINALPSASGMWFTIVSGVWAPEKDSYLYLTALEEVASSFSINDQYAQNYIRAGLQRLKMLQQQTMDKMNELNREREKNQAAWEDRQRHKEFSESKWDDYRRGQSYWVSDIEGGKVYATDQWGTRDTATGDYYEGRPYNWTNFEGENPRYNESMREINSYELKQMEGR
jgi:hypothetical protein